MSVSLRPMSDEEFATWLPETQAWYADHMANVAGVEAGEAAAKAAADTEELFPDGRRSPEQLLYVLEVEGRPVGTLWLCERRDSSESAMHVYNIRIAEQYRGRGYGKAAMLLAEEEARRRGIDRMSLNVLAGNTVARALYSSLGYEELGREEQAIAMSKRLEPAVHRFGST